MKNKQSLLEEFNVTELEDRLEFGICGGSGDGDGSDDNRDPCDGGNPDDCNPDNY